MKCNCFTQVVGSILLLLASNLNSAFVECSGNATDIQEASVEEVPNPTMTIERADVTDYRPPGYHPFHNGEPFFMEKDPVTGVVDFNKKINAVTLGYSSKSVEFTSASKQDRVLDEERANNNTDSDYYEDEEVAIEPQDFKEDEIDRKDGNIEGDTSYRPNDLFKNNPYKISPDLHQFLNLPVHYSSSDKFPLISSSYANTKIQGTGGNSNNSNGYSNHKYVTSSTQSPSYYTMWHTSSTSTPKSTTQREVITTTTTSTPRSTTPSTTTKLYSTTSKSPYSEYPDGEDLAYSDYDLDYEQQSSYTPTHSTPSTVLYSKYPTTYHGKVTTPKSTTIKMYDEETEDDVSIVTSLPIDEYFYPKETASSSTTTSSTTTTTTQKSTTEKQRETTLPTRTTQTTKITFPPTSSSSKPSTLLTRTTEKPTTLKPISSTQEDYQPIHNNVYNNYYGSQGSFSPMTEEPFRPIFGPLESSQSSQVPVKHHAHNEIKSTPKPYFEYHAPIQETPLPSGNQGKIEFIERIPVDEQASFTFKKPVQQTQEPSRPQPSYVYPKYPQENANKPQYSQENVNKPQYPQENVNKPQYSQENVNKPQYPQENVNKPQYPQENVNKPQYSNQNSEQTHTSNENTNIKPLHETTHYGRPQPTGAIHSVSKIPPQEAPTRHPPQKRPPFIRLPEDNQPQFQLKKHSNVSIVKIPRPEIPMQANQRPIPGLISPSVNKQSSQQTVKFNTPPKQDNHYIKIPMNQENPSYSLQTSFSIGAPSDHAGEKDIPLSRPGQAVGVGQILFPDDTPDHSLSESHKKETIVKGRPQNPRPYITTTYSQNINPQSQPSPILPQRPQRVPIPDLRPPKPSGDAYPRPHWENHGKPPLVFNPNNKPEIPVSSFSTMNRVKPEPPHGQRHDLPNILPQFRPNAKVGGNEYPMNIGIPNERPMREPMDTLQPPPLPQPQHLRANRNDDDVAFLFTEDTSVEKSLSEKNSTAKATYYPRNGPQATSRVTTLQMMQQTPARKTLLRTDYHDHRKDRPVFLVYPSNAGPKPSLSNEGVVVVGAQGPQKPLPPSNLVGEIGAEDKDSDPFPLDDDKHFSIASRDRVDTPILKTKTPNKPAVKNEFPYAILKPQENVLAEERILTNSAVTKEYNAFSPTVSSSTEDIKDHDSEINIIPYLQDYMPFATKKPSTVRPLPSIPSQLLNGEKGSENRKDSSTVRPISVTLNTKLGSTTYRPAKPSEHTLPSKPVLLSAPSHHHVALTSGDSEFTVGAMMNYQKNTVNHRPVEIQSSQSSSIQPKPIDLEPPFQASLSAPQSQGWTVIKKIENKSDNERQDNDPNTNSEQTNTDKFDFDNFKPELFGGFKPIIPQESEGKKSSHKEEDTLTSELDE
ncbi:hypothetical protein LSTR_LSTR000778 [Laodelphax striatellus]|uniref:Uncharacterized protein n=1 Tax=Laodelphax striatellus TaxID=195883 RepID=A0A482XG28_LAOST|nr:hypothetical protein LSTR_LSTR000778 [Laodelphax striatellus]